MPYLLVVAPLLEHVEYKMHLLSVMIRQILFCGCRGYVRNVSANQGPGRQSCLQIDQTHK